jgi:hypothetical protein
MGRSLGPVNIDDIAISPKFRNYHWQMALNDEDWETMVSIFKDRIEGRFLKPIRLIESDTENGEFSGFSILALDCLIIETLNQFYLGTDETEGEHRKAFWNFFRKSEYFKMHFTRKTAYIFYTKYRCGILHQAQTKGKSLIRIDEYFMVKAIKTETNEPKDLIVNRALFHKAIEDEISHYIHKLKSGGEGNLMLRNNFITKIVLVST